MSIFTLTNKKQRENLYREEKLTPSGCLLIFYEAKALTLKEPITAFTS